MAVHTLDAFYSMRTACILHEDSVMDCII